MAAMLLYSASANDLDIDVCFLDFHETCADPKYTQKPVTGRLVSLHATQSTSQKAVNCSEDVEAKNKPAVEVCFRYLTTCRAADQWGFRGF